MVTKRKKYNKNPNQVYLVTYEEMVELCSAYIEYFDFADLRTLKKAAKRVENAWEICTACPLPNKKIKELGL